VAAALSIHMTMCKPVKLAIDERGQTVKRLTITLAPIQEHLRYL
jgi:hypothetical protein